MGSTEVPAEPERVVVLDSSFLDASLALGVTPVAATEAIAGSGMPAYLGDAVADMEVVGLIEEPNPEAIAAQRPAIGRAHVCTPVTNAQLVCRLLLDKTHKKNHN